MNTMNLKQAYVAVMQAATAKLGGDMTKIAQFVQQLAGAPEDKALGTLKALSVGVLAKPLFDAIVAAKPTGDLAAINAAIMAEIEKRETATPPPEADLLGFVMSGGIPPPPEPIKLSRDETGKLAHFFNHYGATDLASLIWALRLGEAEVNPSALSHDQQAALGLVIVDRLQKENSESRRKAIEAGTEVPSYIFQKLAGDDGVAPSKIKAAVLRAAKKATNRADFVATIKDQKEVKYEPSAFALALGELAKSGVITAD